MDRILQLTLEHIAQDKKEQGQKKNQILRDKLDKEKHKRYTSKQKLNSRRNNYSHNSQQKRYMVKKP